MPACTYCGSISSIHRDHVVPVSSTGLPRNYSLGEIVPACAECNALLGDKMFTSVRSRAEYLLGVYPKRYRKILNTPDWTEEELEDLSYALRHTVEQGIQDREYINQRIDNLWIVLNTYDSQPNTNKE